MKENKGITLINLSIIIILLIILAVVVINLSLGDNGFFKIARRAAKDYKTAGANEEKVLEEYTNVIDEYTKDRPKKLLAEEFKFIPANSDWKIQNVKEALDYLYSN